MGGVGGARWRRWGARAGSVTALVLVPVLAGGSLSTLPASHVLGPDPVPAPSDVPPWVADLTAPDQILVDVMAGRSAERAEMTMDASAELERGITVSSSKGVRVWTASAMSDHGMPRAAERAYRRAAAVRAKTDPGCQLPWTLLAAIGRVESDHGRYDGARLGADGVSRPRIIGLRLDGLGPVAAIRDTDDGRLDGDKVWDRAVGPMQFIPATWKTSARDGDGDGRKNPHDLDDAAAAAAAYLCSGSGSLAYPETQAAAVHRYNQDDYYVALVLAFERGYRTGVFVMPPPPIDEDAAGRRRERRIRASQAVVRVAVRDRRGHSSSQDGGPAPGPSSAPAPKPAPASEPSPIPAPKPTPTPPPVPLPTSVSGVFVQCPGGYCLGGELLDLGSASDLDAQAAGDFDGDGTIATNGVELAGLEGTQVTMLVVPLDGLLSVSAINLIPLV